MNFVDHYTVSNIISIINVRQALKVNTVQYQLISVNDPGLARKLYLYDLYGFLNLRYSDKFKALSLLL